MKITFEDFLADKHMAQHPEVLDDDLPDKFNDWLEMDADTFIAYGEEYKDREIERGIGLLRQWLNEDRITDRSKMVTSEQIKSWFNLN